MPPSRLSPEIWDAVGKYYAHVGSGLEPKRAGQRLHWLEDAISEALQDWFTTRVSAVELERVKKLVQNGSLPVAQAVESLLASLK